MSLLNLLIRRGAAVADPLDISLWQVSGYRTGRVTMSRPVVPGPLILTNDQLAGQAVAIGMTLIGSSMLDGLIEAEIVVTGWNAATYGDTITAGAGGRLAGTNGVADWNGYWGAVREAAAGNRQFQNRISNAGVGNNIGTSTTGLPAGWTDGATHIVTQLEMAGDQITTRAKVLGAGSWAHNVTTTNAVIAPAGLYGIFAAELEQGMSLQLHSFTVTPA